MMSLGPRCGTRSRQVDAVVRTCGAGRSHPSLRAHSTENDAQSTGNDAQSTGSSAAHSTAKGMPSHALLCDVEVEVNDSVGDLRDSLLVVRDEQQ